MNPPDGPEALRAGLLALWQAALRAADARAGVKAALQPWLAEPASGRTVVVGAGKASAAMALALEEVWPADLPLSGVVLTRHGCIPAHDAAARRIVLREAAHPVPDEAGLAGTQALLQALSGLGPRDRVVALMSGGGSALMAAPWSGWTLADEQALNRQLLRCGAPIGQMNIVRRHLSALKGGRLAAHARPARLLTLAVSDVPGDALADIASGPTVPDASTCADALAVATRWGLQLPPVAWQALREGRVETPFPGDAAFAHDQAQLVMSPARMLAAVARQAQAMGCEVEVLGDALEGEARELGRHLAERGLARQRVRAPGAPPLVLLSGGEATVTMAGAGAGLQGSGGRNRETALAAALHWQGAPGLALLSADTDGLDGTDDAAGAFVLPDTWVRAQALGVDLRRAMQAHDSGGAFHALGDALVTGPTFTNVNDFRALLVMPSRAA